MSDITISYKGASIATMDASGTKTLLTEGKYCEDDITIDYVKSGGGGQELIDNIIGNVQIEDFVNTTYTGNNLILSRIPAINVTIQNATVIGQSSNFNTKTTGIISLPNVTSAGASAMSSGLKATVLYMPKIGSTFGSNAFTNDCQNLIKLVVGSGHPIANTNSSLRYATTNFKALVFHSATSAPSLSDAALARLNACGIVTNADGYIYVLSEAYNSFINGTNWSTLGSSKYRKIEDYPLIDAPTTWIPTEAT